MYGASRYVDRSEGFPRTGYFSFLGVILPGLDQIQRVLGKPPPSLPSFGPNMSKSDISPKWTYPKIPGYVIFQK